MMINLLIKVFLLSISGTIIALILLTLKPLIKLRLSKRWQYYIWLAVILRFLIPFTPEISLMNSIYNEVENSNLIVNIPTDLPMTGIVGIIVKYIGIAWLIITLILFLKKIISYYIYIRFIKVNRKIIDDVNIIGIYNKVCTKMKIKRKVELYSYKMISSPMLIGLIKPYILLPEAMIQTTEGLEYVLLHEITHHKQKDFLYKWLLQMIACIHFFNPIIFLIRDIVNKNCELSCDETIIKRLDKAGKKAYGFALINSLEVNKGYKKCADVSIMLCEDAKQIKERLDAIINYKKGTRTLFLTTFMLTIMICFSSIYIGVFKNVYSNCSCRDKLTDWTTVNMSNIMIMEDT